MRTLLIRRLTGLGALFLGIAATAQTTPTPVFQYAAFYNSLLEFTWTAPLTMDGPVHANGDMYVGSSSPLTFNKPVTTTGTISSPAWFGKTPDRYTAAVTYNDVEITNTPPLNLYLGTTNSPREIVNMPPPGEDPASPLSQQRYYNKAKIVLLVTSSNVTMIAKTSATDPAPAMVVTPYYPTNNSPSNYASITSSLPFLVITNYWPTPPITVKDQRENAKLKLTEIDVSSLKRWLVTNALLNAKFPNNGGVYASATDAPNILYVADNRPYTNGQLTAVRLRNAQIIPTNLFVFSGTNTPSGFTLATPNPLYIYGNYNCPNSAQLNTTNTSRSYPASLISDALTILSPNWQDSQSTITLPINSGGSSTKNMATSTTINAAVLTGVVYSTGSDVNSYSGGVQNLPRLLEDWGNGGGVTLTLNTSIVNLYNSVCATNQYQQPGVYYYAPTRQFSFDHNFLSPWKLPPGTPMLGLPAPFITVPPQAPAQPVLRDQAVQFSVATVGATPMAYQWFYNGTHAIAGATNAFLVLSNVQPTDTGGYSVQITNLFGSATSTVVSLSVAAPPVIDPPLSNLTLVVGEDTVFAVAPTGTAPFDYQWLCNGTNILDATNATLLLTNVSSAQSGEYTVIVTNIAGAATNSANLDVGTAPAIDSPMQDLILVAGQNATFNLSASGTGPLTYLWQFNGAPLPDVTDSTLSLTNVTPDQSGEYVVTVTNTFGVTSNAATLSVYTTAAAKLTALPSLSGGQFQFSVSGVPGFTYVIEASTNFIDWEPLLTNTSPFTLTDDQITNRPALFYRSVYLP